MVVIPMIQPTYPNISAFKSRWNFGLVHYWNIESTIVAGFWVFVSRLTKKHFLENKEKQLNPAETKQTIVCNYYIPILKQYI